MSKLRRTVSLLLILALMAMGAGLAEQELRLPGAIRVVTEESFAGLTGVQRVTLPEGVEEIQRRAFADSGVTEINLPASLKSIADDAFTNTPLTSVSAVEGTYAYNWAVAHGYIAAPSTLTASVTASAATAKAGAAVTWTVTATGNTGVCRYTFKLYRGSALIAEEGRGNQNTFTRTLDTAGSYHMVCVVADDRSETSASGGSYTYQIFRNGARIYTSPKINDNVLTYKFDQAATYYLTCNLGDGSKMVTLTSAEIVVTKADTGTGLSIQVETEADSLSATDSQVWTVIPSGGKAPYRYSYTLKRGTTTVETQAYSADNRFRHTFFKAGSYTLNVKVKDGSGTVASEDYAFTVNRGATEVTGVIRMYVDTDSLGNIIESTGKTGHFELQLNNESGDGICFDNKRYDNPVFSFGSTGGGAVTVFEAVEVSRHSAQLYTFSFDTTADKVDQLLHTIIPNQYLNINSEAENDIGYVYSSKKSYVIKENNCFTTVAAWCTVLGYNTPSEIVSSSSSYTDYIAWKIYNQYGSSWTYAGDF